MKQSNLFIKSLMVIAVLFMVSCNNDDGMTCPETMAGPLSPIETGFSGSWKLIAMQAEDAVDITDDDLVNPSKDIFSQYSVCQRDLVYEFNNDRNYSYKQGYSSDECQNKFESKGTWSLSTENSLTFVENCASETIQIKKSETGDSFTYESNLNYRDDIGNMKITKVTFTYKKVGVEINPI